MKWRPVRAGSKSRSRTRTAIQSSCSNRLTDRPNELSAPKQPHRRVALEQVEAQPRRLPPLARQTAVAVEEDAGVALGDWGELGNVLRRSDTEILFARLAGAEDFAGPAQPQIFLGDAEAVVGLAHHGQASPAGFAEVLTAQQD